MNRKQIFAIAIALILFLMACDFSSLMPASVPTTDPQTQIAQALAGTQLAQTQAALNVQLTVMAMATNTPQPTFTPQFTYTSSIVTVSVSINTNCRTGPGNAYPIIGALAVGQTAEVVGRSASSDNWIIKLPGSPSVTCWLWGQYATVVGNTAGLPIYTPPPTPTSTQQTTITITIYNNCGVIIFYAYISGSDDPSWGSDELGASTIPLGGSFSWIYDPGTYDVKVEDTFHGILYTWFGLLMTTDQYLVACP